MNGIVLRDYFDGLAVKRLSAVEAHPERSNQHEFNGVQTLKNLFGENRRRYAARFIYLGESEEDTTVDKGFVTWYDAREFHPTRSEYRLYFPLSAVSKKISERDLLVLGKRPDDTVFIVVAKAESTAENQLLWLANITAEPASNFIVKRTGFGGDDERLGYVTRTILEELGVEVDRTKDEFLGQMLSRFPGGFPSTREFSSFARETTKDVSAQDEPDDALVIWMEQEEMLFRTYERHIVREQLQKGYGDDIDRFVADSLSVQNRRKARAGQALENHMEKILQESRIRFSRGEITENRSRPDFIFPGIMEYRDNKFPACKLAMLGVKSTCKDRWRQVLAEAKRIDEKHLLTLEPGISDNQTEEMKLNSLRLVVPRGIHITYKPGQRSWLMCIKDFFDHVITLQKGMSCQ